MLLISPGIHGPHPLEQEFKRFRIDTNTSLKRIAQRQNQLQNQTDETVYSATSIISGRYGL